jgi:hypothetical protein
MVDAATGDAKVIVPGNVMREPRVFRYTDRGLSCPPQNRVSGSKINVSFLLQPKWRLFQRHFYKNSSDFCLKSRYSFKKPIKPKKRFEVVFLGVLFGEFFGGGFFIANLSLWLYAQYFLPLLYLMYNQKKIFIVMCLVFYMKPLTCLLSVGGK